ncbi:cytochrome c biogenesis CcdA family protein [Nocardioides bruguierae]|uniref:cytochrome c biogenesis CcdA family protein n=1 Tax=Nocardioides bruguierae TaxID=2945102 RepID=UPI0020215B3A|nr:cytochrome c biogenesis CcdA family protein [Nocardioides bruguierae]MCL8023824.1 cytochrome c biogenesis CcdA family protein [Nocardioides bruguierae]
MGDWFAATTYSGSLLLAVPVAIVAGLVSFFSPCVLPLLPGYLSYATGLSGADLANGEASARRGRMLAGSVLFVLGFTVWFVILGALVGSLRTWVLVNKDYLDIGLGILVILLGLAFMGLLRVPWLQRDLRVHKVPAVGLAAAPVLGFLFGLGWAPCIGPTLGVILGLGYDQGTAGRGAFLLVFYSLGLGIPFVVAALAWGRMSTAIGWIRRHQVGITRAGGAMLVLVGVLILTGWWDWAVTWLQSQVISDYEVSV